jgi:hypothetical protein
MHLQSVIMISKKLAFLFPWLSLSLAAFCETGLEPFPGSGNPRFQISIEQDGRLVPIKDNTVRIRRAPFAIVVGMNEPMGILVIPSIDPEFYDLARKGAPWEKITEKTGMAEDNFNPGKEIVLFGDVPSYWHYIDDANHRFSTITKEENGLIVCRRNIENLVVVRENGEETRIAVAKSKQKALFLVFFNIEYIFDDDYDFTIKEYQRQVLKVEFRFP